ncbi:MAG: Cytidylyltransferase family protein [Elusimicrobia bacterium ADurb.Bin231]|nr:MAG: Cytidylyltransferase family protein [Elusimicrobia bacterium ADurb.Bin231]
MTPETKRKLSHWFILLVPFFYIVALERDTVLFAVGISIVIISIFEIARQKSNALNGKLLKLFDGIYRKEEINKTSTLIYTLSGIFFAVFFFEKHIAVLSILFLTFGDGFAALAGERWGKHKIFKGTKKTVEGSIANLSSCLIVGFLYSGFYEIGYLKIIVASLAVTIVEVIPKTKDNIIIPVVAGLLMTVI